MYYPAVGLEIHIELNTKSKLFCSCLNDPEEKKPNTNICPVCMGHPGVLPVINREAVKKVIKTGLALNCEISTLSRFDRKNYFYPDLPKGYQISQHYLPFCKKGTLFLKGKKIRIREIHLEEDTARLIHPKEKKYSLVDFNRAGVPLMELVTEPDFDSGQEARRFTEELKLILRYLDVSDADMEKGQMRIEANVSVSSKEGELGTRVEIKNINSFRAVEKAITYEIERQREIISKGGKIIQQTFGWDPEKEKTYIQREKEMAFDYRYFPEPDLPVLKFHPRFIEEIKKQIPELPQEKRRRFQREYLLGEKEVMVLVQEKNLADYFEKLISELPPNLSQDELRQLIKLTTNYLLTDLLGLLKEENKKINRVPFSPPDFASLIMMIFKGKISSRIAKIVLEKMFFKGGSPEQIIKEEGLVLIQKTDELEAIVREIIEENPGAVHDYRQGKREAIQFLIGQVMRKTKGKADPGLTREILVRLLA